MMYKCTERGCVVHQEAFLSKQHLWRHLQRCCSPPRLCSFRLWDTACAGIQSGRSDSVPL